jgi:hypothetical protein
VDDPNGSTHHTDTPYGPPGHRAGRFRLWWSARQSLARIEGWLSASPRAPPTGPSVSLDLSVVQSQFDTAGCIDLDETPATFGPARRPTMAARTDLERTLEAMIRDIVKSGEVVDVVFERGEEVPYENMLKVQVLYRTEKQALNIDETLKVPRELLSKMVEMKDPDFPYVQFMPYQRREMATAAQ